MCPASCSVCPRTKPIPAFALDRIAEHLIHFWRTNLGYRAMPDDSWTRALFMQDALHKQLEIQL